MAYIYIVRCEDDTLYTGIAKDVKQRMRAHITGTGKAKYTRSHPIKELCALWETELYRDAARLEYAVKRLTRNEKMYLIQNPDRVSEMFEKLSDIEFHSLPLFDIHQEIDG